MSIASEITTATTTCQASKPCDRESRGWRHVVRNFTPSWFSVNMGTGITSILLHNIPYNGHWLQYISYIIFALNVLLFILFLVISILRYTLYPKIFLAMIRHPAQSLFLGTFPMGLATIINMIVFVCVPAWEGNWWKLAWVLWWIDAAFSLGTCFALPFIIMTVHKTELNKMTAAWLLPIVAPIVASATGGIVAEVIPNPQHALITLIVSYVLWGTGVPLAMCVLVVYFLRLTTCQLPPKEVVVSTFLPLGPLGQGSFAIMQLGTVANSLLQRTDTLPVARSLIAGEVLYTAGFMLAIIMWGFGLVWLFFALAAIYTTSRFPFNMGWWGFTFPLGVFTVATTTFGKELPSAFFRVLGTIFSICVTLLWMIVICGTVYRACTREIFVAPCLKDLEKREAEVKFNDSCIEQKV
ncbi:hypothetical protein DOTSEDRAFT_136670 [Dothistroma septosporum NZE10]|uniref:Sulfite efflux pump SSU1 n=1 Tax=Dothistroma septosporum (strain NZE10 / CBS 128990) TaxID=675120 RepID=N1PFQ3_DOTSN|nr:hypothetical protein DOTSEDRAFT_136670 [Dothistroma septosporum NZE10]